MTPSSILTFVRPENASSRDWQPTIKEKQSHILLVMQFLSALRLKINHSFLMLV